MPLKTPAYLRHSASGQAVVRFSANGKRKTFYLGPFDSSRSKERYQQVLAEHWRPKAVSRPGEWATIEELMAAYLQHCQSYYRDSNETENVVLAMRPLRRLFGGDEACEFGPKKLKRVRQAMVDSGLTRQGCNKRISKLRRMFKWGVEDELVPASVLHELTAVSPLSAGRTNAPEAKTVEPAQDHDVDAAIEFASPPIAAMVQLQRLTGMRPGELVIMRRCDVDATGAVWTYTPAKHKNQWRIAHCKKTDEPMLRRSARASTLMRLTDTPPLFGS